MIGGTWPAPYFSVRSQVPSRHSSTTLLDSVTSLLEVQLPWSHLGSIYNSAAAVLPPIESLVGHDSWLQSHSRLKRRDASLTAA